MSKVLVTGGAGFVGSHLVDELIKEGYDVDVWDNLYTGKLENVNPKANFYEIDCVEANLTGFVPYDVIFHMAGYPRIQPSFKSPHYTFRQNILATERMLELAVTCRARFVYAGSSSFYGGHHNSPYAFSKWTGEETCRLFNNVFDVPVAMARFFNVYGPRHLTTGDYATVVGIFEKQKLNDEPLTVVGDGQQRRDFTHIYDIVKGLVAMSRDDWDAKVFNLGTGTNWSILEVAEMFKPVGVEFLPDRPGEYPATLADTTEAEKHLGWRAELRLDNYISEFINENY